jgi:hypothetical protein
MSLVLAASFPQPETEQGKETRRAMAERLSREGMTSYAEGVLTRMIAPHNIAALPDVAAHVLQMMKATAPESAAAALRGRAERPPYEPTLAQFDRPALVVVGRLRRVHDARRRRHDGAFAEALAPVLDGRRRPHAEPGTRRRLQRRVAGFLRQPPVSRIDLSPPPSLRLDYPFDHADC